MQRGVRRKGSASCFCSVVIADAHLYVGLKVSGPNLHLCINTGTSSFLLALMGTNMPDSSSFFLAANSIAMALAVCIEYTADSHADKGKVHAGGPTAKPVFAEPQTIEGPHNGPHFVADSCHSYDLSIMCYAMSFPK